MAELGKYNTLTINRFVDFGAYLDGDDLGEILIPKKYLPEEIDVDDEIDVFIYLDSEERYVATTEDVLAGVDETALMRIASVNEHGAFAEWGPIKHLFIPFREQHTPLVEGEHYVIHVYIDDITYRIVGSTLIDKHINHDIRELEEKEEVKILVWRKTNLGYLAIIENHCYGLIFKNQVFDNLQIGDERIAYIKKIRDDQKIDLTLQKEGYEQVKDFSFDLHEYIYTRKTIQINDKSSPEIIKETFGVSKKVFKKAVGRLLKEGKIKLINDGIEIIK